MIFFLFIFSFSEYVQIERTMLFRKYKLKSGDSFEIDGKYEHLLVIFREYLNIKVSVQYSNSKDGEAEQIDELDISTLPYAYLPKFGNVQIKANGNGYVSFTAICLPKECSTRLWISNVPGSSLKITGGSKWPYRLTKETTCAIFGYAPLIKYSYQINLNSDEKVRFVGSQEIVVAKGDRTGITDVNASIIVLKGLSAGRGKYIKISTTTNVNRKPTTQFSNFVLIGNKFYSSFWYNATYFPYFCFIIILGLIIYYIKKRLNSKNIKENPKDIGYLRL